MGYLVVVGELRTEREILSTHHDLYLHSLVILDLKVLKLKICGNIWKLV